MARVYFQGSCIQYMDELFEMGIERIVYLGKEEDLLLELRVQKNNLDEQTNRTSSNLNVSFASDINQLVEFIQSNAEKSIAVANLLTSSRKRVESFSHNTVVRLMSLVVARYSNVKCLLDVFDLNSIVPIVAGNQRADMLITTIDQFFGKVRR